MRLTHARPFHAERPMATRRGKRRIAALIYREGVVMPIQPKLLFPICLAVAAPAFAQHGIDANDINKNGTACTDFFDYANGAWRSAHSDSRLHGSLEQALGIGRDQQGARARHPGRRLEENRLAERQRRATVRRFLCRVHGREPQSTQLGIKPVQPMLDEVRAIKTKADLQRTIEHLHDVGIARAVRLVRARRIRTIRRRSSRT